MFYTVFSDVVGIPSERKDADSNANHNDGKQYKDLRPEVQQGFSSPCSLHHFNSVGQGYEFSNALDSIRHGLDWDRRTGKEEHREINNISYKFMNIL